MIRLGANRDREITLPTKFLKVARYFGNRWRGATLLVLASCFVLALALPSAIAVFIAIGVLAGVLMIALVGLRAEAALERSNAQAAAVNGMRANITKLTKSAQANRSQTGKVNERLGRVSRKLDGRVDRTQSGVRDLWAQIKELRRDLRNQRGEIAALKAKVDAGLSAAPSAASTTTWSPEAKLASRRAKDERLAFANSCISESLTRVSAGPAPIIASPPVLVHKMGSPQVSVVVPNFDDGRFLEACLRSVQNQTFDDFECIIVDDASSDNSAQVAARFQRSDSRFKLVRHLRNGGLSASRNTGIRHSSAPLIAFLDSDDLFLRNNLAERVDHMHRLTDPTVAGVYSGIRQEPESVALEELPDAIDGWKRGNFADFITSKGECPFNCHAPLLRTDVVRQFGGFDETMLVGAEDWDLWLRMMRNGYIFRPTKNFLAIYRQKAHSMVRAMPADHLDEARVMLDSVQRAIDPGQIVADAPFVFSEPWAFYDNALTLSRRTFQFAGLAAVTQDSGQLDRTLETLDGSLLPVISRHIDPQKYIETGLRRSLSLHEDDWKQVKQLSTLAEAVTNRVRAIQPSSKETPQKSLKPTATEAQPTVLFVPENAAAVPVMANIAARLPSGTNSVFLSIERESGASGVADALGTHSLDSVSLNHWLLTKRSHSTLVVRAPLGQVVSQIVVNSESAGAATVVLPCDEALLLPEAPMAARKMTPVADAPELISMMLLEVEAVALENSLTTHEDFYIPRYSIESAKEEYPLQLVDSDELLAFKDKHKGERCVIIGNGPSLNDLDLTLLASETTIAVNGIFYAAEDMGFDPSYYVVEDSSVMKENIERIKDYKAGHKFFPSLYRELYGEEEGVTFFMMNRGFYEKESGNFCVPRFSTDAAQRLYCGQSVTMINLQLAYYMGFTEVYLIGMDFSYVIPDSDERNGDVLTSSADDVNHFHPDYFGKGKTWKDPKLDRVLANYAMAKAMYEADNRKILNATAGGNLHLFDRVDYHAKFK